MSEERHIYNYYTMTKNAQVVYILALKYSHSLDNGMLCICA